MLKQIRLDFLWSKEKIDIVALNYGKLVETYERLASNAEEILAVDGAANNLCNFLEHKDLPHPTKIVGDFDSINSSAKEFFQNVPQILIEDQDSTDLEKALGMLNLDKVTLILGEIGGRFDHSISILSTLLRPQYLERDIFLLSESNIAFALNSGSNQIHLGNKLDWKYCGYFPLQGQGKVSTWGLKWDLQEAQVQMGGLVSSSNEPTEQVIHINTTVPLIFSLSN